MPDRWIDDHVGDETRPRSGFFAELEQSITAAWRSDEAARPSRVAVSRPSGRRARWTLLAGVGTAAALVAALTAIALTRDDGSTPGPADPAPTTPAPIPTVASSTVAPTPAPTAPTPTTLAPTSTSTDPSTTIEAPAPTTVPAWVPTDSIPTDSPEGFFPACVERRGAPAASDASASATFGPLTAAPALTVLLPASVDPADYPASQRVTSPKGTATLIPGGLLIALNQANGDESSLLAAVNLDGSVRWVRCTGRDQRVSPYDIVGSNAAGAEAFVHVRDANALDDPQPTWVQVNLDTGEFGPTLAERVAERNPSLAGMSAAIVVGQSRTHLLLASSSPLSGQDDVLLLVDRATLIAERLPDAAASTDNLPTPSLDELGRPVLSVNTPSGPQVVRVYDGRAWIADVRSVVPPHIRFEYEEQTGRAILTVVDGAGDVLWRRDDLVAWSGEGFSAAVAGEVTIARVCTDAPGCSNWTVVGLRTSDGEEMWRLDEPAEGGVWDVGPIGDGFMLVREPATSEPDGTSSGGAWIMVETSTGRSVDGQRWDDPTTFEAQCCGGGEFVHVRRFGGAVVAINERRITVWFPAGTDLEPATATLP